MTVQSAKSKHKWVAVAQFRRNLEAPPSQHKSGEAARSSRNIRRSFLYKVMTNGTKTGEDQQSVPRWTNARALSGKTREALQGKPVQCLLTVCGVKFIFYPNIMWLLKCLPQQSIICPLTCLPQQNIFSSVCLRKTSSHKTISRKTSHWFNWVYKEIRNFCFTDAENRPPGKVETHGGVRIWVGS